MNKETLRNKKRNLTNLIKIINLKTIELGLKRPFVYNHFFKEVEIVLPSAFDLPNAKAVAGDLSVIIPIKQAYFRGEHIDIRSQPAYNLLELLIINPTKTFSVKEASSATWRQGGYYQSKEDLKDVVTYLNKKFKKLGATENLIAAAGHSGYKLSALKSPPFIFDLSTGLIAGSQRGVFVTHLEKSVLKIFAENPRKEISLKGILSEFPKNLVPRAQEQKVLKAISGLKSKLRGISPEREHITKKQRFRMN